MSYEDPNISAFVRHSMPDAKAAEVVQHLAAINRITTYRGRCLECGEASTGGCGCWVSAIYERIPMTILRMLDEADAAEVTA
jgi:hypothetical protein